jgi:hypothetical protein
MRENCIVKRFMVFTPQQIILGRRNQERCDRLNMRNVSERGKNSVKKPEGKRILGRLRSRLEGNIQKDLEEM